MKDEIGKANRLGNRSSNQDRFSVIERPEAVLMILADGMGGHKGGGLAADTVVHKFTEAFSKTSHPIADPEKFFLKAFERAHNKLLKLGAQHNPPISPRTTGVACLIQNGAVWWAHVGDSRFYLYRDTVLVTRTRDHSTVEELYQQGKITKKQIKTHPNRHQITRCIGGNHEPPKVSLGGKTVLEPDDIVLLCSDGFWNHFTNEEIGMSIYSENKISSVLDGMSQKAEMSGYPKSDNISVIAMRWISNDPKDEGKKSIEKIANRVDKNQIDPDHARVADAIDEINQALEKVEQGLKE
jgi:serine/threonine protein phosphatase PrpC